MGRALESTVLIIDDDVDVSEANAEVLRDSGYHGVVVNGGQEPLRYLRSREQAPGSLRHDRHKPAVVADGYLLRPGPLDVQLDTIARFCACTHGGGSSEVSAHGTNS